MGQPQRARKADDPALRAEVERLRRAGLPLNRKALAAQFGVGEGTVQQVRSEISRELAAEAGPGAAFGGRTVQEFDGAQLLEARRHKLLMQDELAEMAGVSRGEIGHLERGHRKPTLRTLRNLAAALGVDAADLLKVPAGEAHLNGPRPGDHSP